MPWFKVDDGFGSHPKVRAIPRRARMAAIGVWTACGLWASHHLTDGDVPADVVEDEGGRRADAEALVAGGLWHASGHACPRCPQPAPGHYQFHDWPDWQPTREQVLAERAAARARMTRIRKRRKGDPPDDEPPVGSGEPTGPVRPNSGGTSGAVRDPRPGPARNYLLTLVSRLAAGDAHATPQPPPAEQIAAWQDLAGPAVDLEAEAAAYLMRHGDQPARDERGAWLGWLRSARRRHDQADAAARAGATPTPAAPPCPLHPQYPSTRCTGCARESTPAPNLRALRDQQQRPDDATPEAS